MSREKQIEELTTELIKTNRYGTLNAVAEYLYNSGYRKQEQGVWIFEHEFYGKMLCSNCKEEALVNECNEYVDSDFCPNCGAKMKGGAECT